MFVFSDIFDFRSIFMKYICLFAFQGGKDCAILLLLPWSLKAPKLRAGETRVPKRANKRRKEETEEEILEKREIRETFIVHVQVTGVFVH